MLSISTPIHRFAIAAFVALTCALATLLCASTPALAAEEHPYLASLSHTGLTGACGAAVDPEGDLYVAVNEKVKVYSPTGGLITEFAPAELEGVCKLAVDSSGDVYALGRTSGGESRVDRYVPSVYPPTGATTYKLDKTLEHINGVKTEYGVFVTGFEVYGVAVDPSNQNVYVAEGTHISEYKPNGTLVSGTIGDGLGLEFAYGIGVDGSTHDVYAVTYPTVSVLNAAGTAILATINGTSNPNFPGGFHEVGNNLAVDQANGDVYVEDINGEASKHDVVDEFTETGGFVSQIGPKFGSPEIEFEEAGEMGIATDNSSAPSKGDVYVTSQEYVYAFGPLSSGVTEYPLEVKKEGTGASEGKVTSTPAGISCGATCSHSFPEGETVTLTATEEGATFTKWTGCKAEPTRTTCEVEMTEAKTVKAEFTAVSSTKFPLNVYITGNGKVNGGPIVECTSAGGSACEGKAENTVTLTATPGAGYVLAGWIGCKKTGVETCEVDVTAPSEVTAVFLQEGVKGSTGNQGPQGSTGSEGMEGAAGRQGQEGEKGANGGQGPAGEKGATGANGAAGAQGPVGPIGPAGPAGPEGPAGKVQVVTCTTVKSKKGKKQQKCTTKTVSGTVTFTTTGSVARATLSRHGAVYAAGTAHSARGHMSLRLLPVRKLVTGRYTLTLVSGTGSHERIRSESFTLR